MTTGRSPEPVLPAADDVPDTAAGLPCRPRARLPRHPGGALADALVALREATAATRFALDIPGAEGARESGAELVRQLDDYVLPRLRRLDAPLLAVVGGSTGAGKSTLVNSLVGAQVTPGRRAAPHHPLAGAGLPPRRRCAGSPTPRVLPELTRTSGAGTRPPARCSSSPRPSLRRGLALLDAPDIDSVVAAQPRARRAAARRRRPVAVRHHRRPLRRRRAVGRAADRPASAAPRSPCVLDRVPPGAEARGRGAPAARCSPTHGLAGRAAVRRPRGAAGTTGCCPPGGRAAARLVLGLAADAAAPGRGGPRAPWTARCDSLPRRAPPALAAQARAQVDAAAAAARRRRRCLRGRGRRGRRRRARRHRCCAARCWPAGRSSSAPASCCAAAVPGRPAARPGRPRRSPAGRCPAPS